MINEIDLRALWKELDDYEKEIDLEQKTLDEVWAKIDDFKKKNEEEANVLILTPEFDFLPPETAISFNVGGQIFDASVEVITQDPHSILAACCRKIPIQTPDPITGLVYFDRDWWLFRHIIAFLRSKVLPSELETLKELYIEASFFRLESLQRAIEEVPLDQISNLSPYISNTWQGVGNERQGK